MRFYIAQSKCLNCIFVRSTGRFNPAHMKMMTASISSLDVYIDDVLLFHDMRLVDFDVDADHIMDVARNKPEQPLHSKLALIAGNELGYGMLRMLAAIRENIPRNVRVFRSIEESLDWLGLELQALPDEIEQTLAVDDPQPDEDVESFGLHIAKNITPTT